MIAFGLRQLGYQRIRYVNSGEDLADIQEVYDADGNPVDLADLPDEATILAAAEGGLLTARKRKKNADIDARTRELIAEGFTIPDGHIFSLSIPAQLTWEAMHRSIKAGTQSTPIEVSTRDGGEYVIQDEAAADAFFAQGFGAVKAHKDGGRALRKQVNAAVTVAEVEAVVDDR